MAKKAFLFLLFLTHVVYASDTQFKIEDLNLQIDDVTFERTGNIFSGKDAEGTQRDFKVSNFSFQDNTLNFSITFTEDDEDHSQDFSAPVMTSMPDQLNLPSFTATTKFKDYVDDLNDRRTGRFLTTVESRWEEVQTLDDLGISVLAYFRKSEQVIFSENPVIDNRCEPNQRATNLHLAYGIQGNVTQCLHLLLSFLHEEVGNPETVEGVFGVNEERLQTVKKRSWNKNTPAYKKWRKLNEMEASDNGEYTSYERSHDIENALIVGGSDSLLEGCQYLKEGAVQQNENCDLIFYRDGTPRVCARTVESFAALTLPDSDADNRVSLTVLRSTEIPLYLSYSSINGQFNGGCFYAYKSHNQNGGVVKEVWEERGSDQEVHLTSHSNTYFPLLSIIDLNKLSFEKPNNDFNNVWEIMMRFGPFSSATAKGLYIELNKVNKDKGKYASRCAEFAARFMNEKKVVLNPIGDWATLHGNYDALDDISMACPLEMLRCHQVFTCKTLTGLKSQYDTGTSLVDRRNAVVDMWDLSKIKNPNDHYQDISTFLANNTVKALKIDYKELSSRNLLHMIQNHPSCMIEVPLQTEYYSYSEWQSIADNCDKFRALKEFSIYRMRMGSGDNSFNPSSRFNPILEKMANKLWLNDHKMPLEKISFQLPFREKKYLWGLLSSGIRLKDEATRIVEYLQKISKNKSAQVCLYVPEKIEGSETAYVLYRQFHGDKTKLSFRGLETKKLLHVMSLSEYEEPSEINWG